MTTGPNNGFKLDAPKPRRVNGIITDDSAVKAYRPTMLTSKGEAGDKRPNRVKPQAKVWSEPKGPAHTVRNGAKLKAYGITRVEHATAPANHPQVSPPRETNPVGHPPFATKPAQGADGTWFAVTAATKGGKGGEAWVSEDGNTWKPFRAPRKASANVAMWAGQGGKVTGGVKVRTDPRTHWVAATPMPAVTDGTERRQHDARLTWSPVLKRKPTK